MITHEELHILMQDSVRESIEQNISRTPTDIALDKRVEHSALVATQVKYLQRAKSKLPSYYAARCIIPSLAFEQSSSEATAATKEIGGESLLELTCGLGVDTYYLSKRFKRVTTIEQNELLASVARENFSRLGVENITVVNSSAESFVAECQERFDWVYADPDRRGERGEKLVRLEDCSPNMLSLRGKLDSCAREGVVIKCSPIFDVDEAFRLYEGCDVEVVSSHDECKEVVIIAQKDKTEEYIIARTTEGACEKFCRAEVNNTPQSGGFDANIYKWLLIPNVALQKGRVAVHALRGCAKMWSNNGFALSSEAISSMWGRIYEIEEIVEFQPKVLNKRLSKRGVEIFKRDFSAPFAQLKFRAGADVRLALTTIEGHHYAIFLKR